MVSAAAPVSFKLALCSIILTTVVAIPLGMIAAMNQNSRIDYAILGSACSSGQSPPMSPVRC
jgi:peptide/nickel transport system permease protein